MGSARKSLNQRIRTEIERRIGSGQWPPGHRIPPEHELMAKYDCSRMTVSKALTALAQAGIIERRRRLGSFVARQHPHLEQVALDIPDIPQVVTERGFSYAYQERLRRLRAPVPSNDQESHFDAGDRVLELHGVHLADGTPFALESRLISALAAPEALGADFSATAPGSWLLEHVPWTRAEHRIRAVNADALDATLLEVDVGAACLVIDRRTWRGAQPVTAVTQAFLGTNYDLVARFSAGSSRRG